MDKKLTSADYMAMEERYGAHNYHSLPVVLERGEGIYLYGVDGKRYFDFLSAYSAVNQGHCHPKIVKALTEQAQKLCLTSRAFYNDCLGPYEKFATEFFGYDKLLPMNSGAEAVETALKLARRWGYKIKGIPENEALIIVMDGNFHGRTITIVTLSNDPESYSQYGPFTPGFVRVPYDDTEAVRKVLEEKGDKVAALLMEPIQGEAGVYVPHDGFIKECYDLCHKHNCLFIADEVQTGMGRTGSLLASEQLQFNPEVVTLAKGIAGGVPMGACIFRGKANGVFAAGDHQSTFGGNPLACAAARVVLKTLTSPDFLAHVTEKGEYMRSQIKKWGLNCVTDVRGLGLMTGVEISESLNPVQIEKECLEAGLLFSTAGEHTLRLVPPLTITRRDIDAGLAILHSMLAK